MDLATRIRTALAAGKPPEHIVAELSASGMSAATAQRLVDRALAAPPLPIPTAAQPADEEDAKDPGGKWALVRGALFFSIGVTITAVTYLLAKPGQKYTITYGFVIAGIIAFARGFRRWSSTEGATFPALMILAALGLPLLAGGGIYEYRREPTFEERVADAIERDEAEKEAVAKEEEAKRKKEEMARKIEIEREMAETQEDVKALQLLIDGRPELRCEGARYFEKQKKYNPYVDGELLTLVMHDSEISVRRCAVDAVVSIGNTTSLERALVKMTSYEGEGGIVGYTRDKLAGRTVP